MALKLGDRVQETSTSTGTGAITLAGAVASYQTFSSVMSNGDTTYYCIKDVSGNNWEVGVGTYTTSGNTLSRTTILSSSNSGSVVNFTSGSLIVFCTLPSETTVMPITTLQTFISYFGF
jgi:hypothetical protein